VLLNVIVPSIPGSSAPGGGEKRLAPRPSGCKGVTDGFEVLDAFRVCDAQYVPSITGLQGCAFPGAPNTIARIVATVVRATGLWNTHDNLVSLGAAVLGHV
jgi:hypothetical protein